MALRRAPALSGTALPGHRAGSVRPGTGKGQGPLPRMLRELPEKPPNLVQDVRGAASQPQRRIHKCRSLSPRRG